MILCPWCGQEVELVDQVCPECKTEVLPEHLMGSNGETNAIGNVEADTADLDIETVIMNEFKCSKCGHDECITDEVAMSGTGISKIMDINYHHFLFVSCTHCGFVEIYNPDVLRGYKSGKLSTVMDILFGR
ncbi:zinc ribbon domain-containing protein [Paenibacillus dokdonensis]|uniref:zinc ribbon domain-containing protein n=1 Tax=Paenibacillus dokdonensis TaxID=2567944 RepID=UPI0010A7FBB9|nr:zinc ribbon domain-containing protein [Paenibacillus dokdonensis]